MMTETYEHGVYSKNDAHGSSMVVYWCDIVQLGFNSSAPGDVAVIFNY